MISWWVVAGILAASAAAGGLTGYAVARHYRRPIGYYWYYPRYPGYVVYWPRPYLVYY
ncbi:MAG: hypothetical protein QW569_03115 [Candidatus Bathyarchaeia archaeon]|nr:hypothetical protein [Candidatus Bathyarchaeota archaeon]